MDGFILARMIHVVSVLFWIGGVAFVTMVVMPSVRNRHAPDNGWRPFTGSKAASPRKPAYGYCWRAQAACG